MTFPVAVAVQRGVKAAVAVGGRRATALVKGLEARPTQEVAVPATVVGAIATTQVTRSGRCVGAGHAFRVLAGSGHATVEVDRRQLPIGPTALGPVEAQKRVNARPRVVRLAVEAKRVWRPIDHLRFAVAHGRARLKDRHVVGHEARVVEEVDEDAQTSHARHASPSLVLLHATEVGAVGRSSGVATHGTETLLGGQPTPKRHGAVVAVKRLVIRTRSATVGLTPEVGQAAVAGGVRTKAPGLVALRLTQGRGRFVDASLRLYFYQEEPGGPRPFPCVRREDFLFDP